MLRVVVDEIPKCVTEWFGVEQGDICQVIRVDKKDSLSDPCKMYLIKTKHKSKNRQNVTLYSHEVKEVPNSKN